MKGIIFELKRRLIEAVKRNPAEGLLFSGGLDSAILAAISPQAKAITISLESYGEDIKYANLCAKKFNLKHYHKRITTNEAIDAIAEVIKILKSFDPAIPNDIVVYFGLKFAKEMGIKKMSTGDGSDELFAGYSFMKDINNLSHYIEYISHSMQFSSNEIGRFFGIEIIQPYLDKKFIEFSLGISPRLKIKREKGKIWGKWILRKAFEDALPREIIWQDKRPLEYGSGMTKLRECISSRISDEEFEKKKRNYPIKFINKEHLYYYEVYRNIIGKIPKPKLGQKACPACGAGIRPEARHCWVCGWSAISLNLI